VTACTVVYLDCATEYPHCAAAYPHCAYVMPAQNGSDKPLLIPTLEALTLELPDCPRLPSTLFNLVALPPVRTSGTNYC
jgi:hypothetical protein